MGLISLRQGDGHPQGDEAEFAGSQRYLFGGMEIDPIGFSLHVAQLINGVRKIFYL